MLSSLSEQQKQWSECGSIGKAQTSTVLRYLRAKQTTFFLQKDLCSVQDGISNTIKQILVLTGGSNPTVTLRTKLIMPAFFALPFSMLCCARKED